MPKIPQFCKFFAIFFPQSKNKKSVVTQQVKATSGFRLKEGEPTFGVAHIWAGKNDTFVVCFVKILPQFSQVLIFFSIFPILALVFVSPPPSLSLPLIRMNSPFPYTTVPDDEINP
jgi:hypothetical protein